MAAQTKLDKDARRRRRDQQSGSLRHGDEPELEPERTCGNCYACDDGSTPVLGHCLFYNTPTRKSNRPHLIGCRDHHFESEV